jgi:uncharacterized membrane protein
MFGAMLTFRQHRISRLEEFSDAVFGFALTLPVITADVPHTYGQLIDLLQGVPAFAAVSPCSCGSGTNMTSSSSATRSRTA